MDGFNTQGDATDNASFEASEREDAAMRISPLSWLPYDHNNPRSGKS